MTVVVADTGEVAAVKRYEPIDCTTNPTLVLDALTDPASEALIAREIETGQKAGLSAEALTDAAGVLAAELAETFDRIAKASNHFRSQEMRGKIRISATPFYANRMILPYLSDFLSNYPDLQIDFDYSYQIAGPVAELCRSFNRILCAKGERPWE